MKVLRKIFLLAFLPILLTSIALSVALWRSSSLSSKNQLAIEANTKFDLFTHKMLEKINGIQAVLRVESARLLPGASGDIVNELKKLEKLLPLKNEGLFYIQPDGILLGTRDAHLDVSGRYYFPLISKGTPFITRIIDSMASRAQVTLIICPRLDDSGKCLGALGASIPASELLAPLNSIELPGGTNLAIIEDTGKINASRAQLQEGVELTIKRLMSSGESNGLRQMGGIFFRRIPGTPWALALVPPAQKSLEVTKRLSIIHGIIALSVFCLAMLSYIVLSKMVANPIENLTTAHSRIQQGDYTARMTLRAGDEFARLGESFNRMAEQLEQSHRCLQDIAANIPGVVFQAHIHANGKITMPYVSQRAKEIFGIDTEPEGFIERFAANIPEQDRGRFIESINKIVSKETTWDYEGEYLKPPGETLWFRVMSTPQRIGGQLFFNGIALDNTNRRMAEEALYESERRMSTLIANLSGIVYRCKNDTQRTMLLMSDGAISLTGYPISDFVDNAKISFGNVIFPEDRDKVWETIQSALKKREPFQLDYRIITAYGVKWVLEKGQGVFDNTRRAARAGGDSSSTSRNRSGSRTS